MPRRQLPLRQRHGGARHPRRRPRPPAAARGVGVDLRRPPARRDAARAPVRAPRRGPGAGAGAEPPRLPGEPAPARG